MNVLSKMMTAIKGGLHDAGEAIIDSQALRILDQEIRDSSEELKQSENNLLELLARLKVSEEKSKELSQTISEHENYALKALDQNDEPLALGVATKLSVLQKELEKEKSNAKGFSENAAQLRSAIKVAQRKIGQIKQQLDIIRATHSVQKAQAAVSKRYDGSNTKLRTAMSSLERIRERQVLNAAKIETAQTFTREKEDQSLDKKLENAGIKKRKDSPDDILERLKKRND